MRQIAVGAADSNENEQGTDAPGDGNFGLGIPSKKGYFEGLKGSKRPESASRLWGPETRRTSSGPNLPGAGGF